MMVTERYFPIWGGAENQLQQLIPHLVRHGCRVEVVTRRWKKEMLKREIVNGTYVRRLGCTGNGHFLTIVFTVALVFYLLSHARRADIIHSHGAVAMGAVGCLIAWLTRKRNVAKIASAGRIPKLQTSFYGKLILAVFKRSDMIIGMTDEIRKELKNIHIRNGAIRRIANAVDTDRFRPYSAQRRQYWRSAKGIQESATLILFSGRIVPNKGLDIVVDAWDNILQIDPQAHLIVLGGGADQADSIEDQIKMEVENLKKRNILFEGETKLPESYLGIADIFVFPSRQEGLPNALMEAMAAGLATVSSRIGGVTDLVEDGKTGILFSPEDSKALAEKIIFFLKNPEIRAKIGSKARAHVLDRYNFERVSRQYYETYKMIIH